MQTAESKKISYDSDDKCWQAVRSREPAADSAFFYAVVTTGVYCYPSCPSRLAKRSNTRFFHSRLDAQSAGYRPCKRCRSDDRPLLERQRLLVQKACDLVDNASEAMRVDELAQQLEVSRFHLQKLFRLFLDISPKQYIKAVRARQLDHELSQQDTVTAALMAAGYDSASAFYAEGAMRLGMPAKSYKNKGEGMRIEYAFGKSRYGLIVVATTEQGICSILFGESRESLVSDLQNRFKLATLVEQAKSSSQWIEEVLSCMEAPELADKLPLDIQGTVFQEKVWSALRKIAPGDTATYTDIAREIGQPTAARAVATACAANPVAVIVPCHRVVRVGGQISGYRWGVERKRALLEDEKHYADSE